MGQEVPSPYFSIAAIAEAEAILFVIDARAGITAGGDEQERADATERHEGLGGTGVAFHQGDAARHDRERGADDGEVGLGAGAKIIDRGGKIQPRTGGFGGE